VQYGEDEPAAGAEHSVDCSKRRLQFGNVHERHEAQHSVKFRVSEFTQVRGVAKTVVDPPASWVFTRELQHPRRTVDTDGIRTVLGQKTGDSALATGKIAHAHPGHVT
jgi:hypothetical protein